MIRTKEHIKQISEYVYCKVPISEEGVLKLPQTIVGSIIKKESILAQLSKSKLFTFLNIDDRCVMF